MSAPSRWKLALYVGAIFLAGGGSGALIAWRVARSTVVPPMPTAEIGTRLRARFQSRLGLSPDQMEKIGPMIDDAMRQVEVIRRDTANSVFANVSNLHERVVLVLTEEQRAKFEELEGERRDYLRKKYGPAQETRDSKPETRNKSE